MSMNFGKGNRGIAFDPTSAFPLDARTYFESYSEAHAKAQSAEEVGSTNTKYHYGMKLLVKDGNTYTWYKIVKGEPYLEAEGSGSGGTSGVGISKIEKTSTSGLIDTYTITLTDGSTSTFTVTNGADGVGISSIGLTSTNGLVDTYTITLTDGNTYNFTVTNGASGEGTTGGALRYHETSFGLIDTIDELVNELRAAGITANDRCLLHCAEYSHPFPDAIVMIDDLFAGGTLVTIKEWIELQNPICYSGTLSAFDAISSILLARDELLTTEDKTLVGAINEVNGKTVNKIASITDRTTYIIDVGDNGIYKFGDFITYDDSYNELCNSLLTQQIPLVAGDNVTFETDAENNVVKINAAGGSGEERIVKTTGTSLSYEAIVEGINELKTGTSLTIIPHMTNIDFPTLNVNGLGAKNIIIYDLKRKQIVQFTKYILEADKPYRVMYNGNQWVLIDYPFGELPYRSENSEGQVLTVGADNELVWADPVEPDVVLADGEYIQGQSSDGTLFNVLGVSGDDIYLAVPGKDTVFNGPAEFNAAAYLRNGANLTHNKAIRSNLADGSSVTMATVNSSDQMTFGSTSCDTYIKGKAVYIPNILIVAGTSYSNYFQITGGGTKPIIRMYDGNIVTMKKDATVVNAIYSYDTYANLWGTWKLNGAAITASWREGKHDIEAFPEKYSTLFDNLHPVRFKYNDGTSGRYHTGLILDELKSAMDIAGVDSNEFASYCVLDKETGEGGIRYEELIALNISEIQKLKKKNQELEQKVGELEKAIIELKNLISGS